MSLTEDNWSNPHFSCAQNQTYSSCLKIPNPSTLDPICIKLAKDKKSPFRVNYYSFQGFTYTVTLYDAVKTGADGKLMFAADVCIFWLQLIVAADCCS
jgi:hypothetical protein